MGFKVFLSYSTDREQQVVVWRLQTLAAAHGITVYVPQRPKQAFWLPSSRRKPTLLASEVRNAIDQSDCVLAIITNKTSPFVEKELSYALGRNKIIIPIVRAGVQDSDFLKQFHQIFRFSPSDPPGKTEAEVVTFLKEQKISKENQQALGALVGIGLGLLLLFALAEK
ncbi:MAG: toll/interleukin-1 receptor domain-containing protein [Terriglobia bacterium]